VEYLIRAWLEIGANAPKLRVIGEGPLRPSLEALTNARGGTNIEFVGAVSREDAIREVGLAKLLIVPSIWFEGFPIVLQDAFAVGTPIAVSNIGSLPTVVRDGENGLVFEARNAGSIASLMTRVWGHDALLNGLGAGARASYESLYTEEANHRRLMEIYASAMAERTRSRKLRFAAV
jgi:glycosyltransferase involved in cell wall biosynthesis